MVPLIQVRLLIPQPNQNQTKMKKIIILVAGFVLACSVASAQNYVKEGNEYSAVHTSTSIASEDVNTGFIWKDKAGNKYEIYITKRNACYIWRTSKKTGKQYKYYLPKDVAKDIASQLGRDNTVDYE